MNLIKFWVDKKEIKKYYKMKPQQITFRSHPHYGKWFIKVTGEDSYCGMAPEKFRRIITNNGDLHHVINTFAFYEYPVFDSEYECGMAIELLHSYLYKRDY